MPVFPGLHQTTMFFSVYGKFFWGSGRYKNQSISHDRKWIYDKLQRSAEERDAGG
jgi:hypothetical protein